MTTPSVPALMTVPDVELVAAGEWQLSTGEATFTPEDLAAAVEASQCPAVGNPVIKLGHIDPRFDGEPAVGRVLNMAVSAEGTKLTGDLAGMPGWLGAVLASAYPQRSIEGGWGFVCQIGHNHPFVITALALLGVAAPGVGVLSPLGDVAALYGVTIETPTAAAVRAAWRIDLPAGGTMPTANAAGVTTEDLRRAYYDAASVPLSYWITEVQVDPLQLIVADDATSKLYRVPVTIKDGAAEFGDPQEVAIEYVDVPAAAAGRRRAALAAASAVEHKRFQAAWDGSQQVKNMGASPTAAQIKKMFALPADTKSGSKLPHHMCSAAGTVGAANLDGCSAGIGAINGAQGGVKGVSASDLQTAYNHLAKHITDGGGTPPDYGGPAASKIAAIRASTVKIRAAMAADTDADDSVNDLISGLDATLDEACALVADTDPTTLPESVAQALGLLVAAESVVDQLMDMLGIFDPDDAGGTDLHAAAALAYAGHGPATGRHAHQHSAFGAQGGDKSHAHEHDHGVSGTPDARHNHAHAKAGAGPTKKGVSEVDFTTDQDTAIRTALGLADDAELTPDLIAAGLTRLATESAALAARASRTLPAGVIAVEKDAWDEQVLRAKAGEEALARIRRNERDTVIASAIGAGKIAPANRPRWEKLWDTDPDGTRDVIAGLAKNAFPTEDIGLPGGSADDDLDEEYRRLFPPGSHTPTDSRQG